MKQFLHSLVVGCALAACGGGNSIDIVGESPENQADEIAGALCDKQVECGTTTISCTQTGDMIDCTGMIEHDQTYDACYAETRPEVLEDLSSCDLTTDQERELQSCINATLDQSCITQAELDAYIEKVEAGDENATLRDPPPECAGLEALFEGCEAARRVVSDVARR